MAQQRDRLVTCRSPSYYGIVLEPTSNEEAMVPNNGYHIIPKPVIAAFIQKQNVVA
jgi:hypothetical protein